jgi:hypothetical protein
MTDDECEAFVRSAAMENRGRFRSWGALALGAALGVAGLGCVVTLQRSLAAQQELIVQMQRQM